MTSEILFIAGSLLCFIFLAALYGDSLKWPLLFEGRWLTALLVLPERLLRLLSELIENGTAFTLANLSWVLACVAGCTGLGMTLFSIGIGIAADATAWEKDSTQPINAGGVLDQVAELPAEYPVADSQTVASDSDKSLLMVQQISGNYRIFGPPTSFPGRSINRDFPLASDYPQIRNYGRADGPQLQVTFERLGSLPGAGAIRTQRIRSDLVQPLPQPSIIRQALSRLSPGGWRTAVAAITGDRRNLFPMAESSSRDVEMLESSVRILPGPLVTSQDLRVIRILPEESVDGEVRIRLAITNQGDQIIDGLLVRELLPPQTEIRSASDSPLLRNNVLTWLISGLMPREERILQFTAIPPVSAVSRRDTVFESITEVSATMAVSTSTSVRADGRRGWTPSAPLPRPQTSRPVVNGQAIVSMEIMEPPVQVVVNEWARVMFRLENTGDAPAENLRILLNLDQALEHAELADQSSERTVEVSLQNLRAGESRLFRLEVRPVAAGNTRSTAELLVNDEQVDLQVFRIGVSEPAE